jgi:hypothetical protein
MIVYLPGAMQDLRAPPPMRRRKEKSSGATADDPGEPIDGIAKFSRSPTWR